MGDATRIAMADAIQSYNTLQYNTIQRNSPVGRSPNDSGVARSRSRRTYVPAN